MRPLREVVRRAIWASAMGAAALLIAGCAPTPMSSPAPTGSNVILNGKQEVPPVSSAAAGSGTITVLMDRSVFGSVTISGFGGTVAHIHLGAPGQDGPVIIPLNRTGEDTWSVPANIRLNDTQYEAFRLGNLYVNVHSAAHPGGEIRGQITP